MACAFHATLAANSCALSSKRFSLKHPKINKIRFDLFSVRDDSVCFACDTWNTLMASSMVKSTSCDGISWFSSWKHPIVARESETTSQRASSRWK
ncbi:hypothetical protein LR48_Vigan10g077200 [Vigna angularis]|uniref:Uncharacterized protein n=1 Tax=Phaseolus angularis TaxID=3914 RepID=A0A0L9VII4_PHAAN|nr:hypothetical protein LR48_Vigan10g077200 [Vigna angularis]